MLLQLVMLVMYSRFDGFMLQLDDRQNNVYDDDRQ